VCSTAPPRSVAIPPHVQLVLEDAERSIVQPADFDIIRSEGKTVMARLTS
jgi:hypothetical protein